MIGYFGNTVFETSSQRVFTFRGMSVSSQARYATHELIGKKPLLEFIGPGLKTVSLPIRLDLSLGVNPLEEINNLAAVRDAGEALPLVIGENYIGDFVLKSMSEDHRHLSNTGVLIVADITLSLEEYADDRVSGNS